MRHNGQLHCEAAENAAIKTHGFSGVVEANLVIANDHEKGMVRAGPSSFFASSSLHSFIF